MVKIVFAYDESIKMWKVHAENCTTPLEALQAFNSVLITASKAIPRIDCNKATPTDELNVYKISVGHLQNE